MRWDEAPVYTRSYDLARYLIERAQRYPRHQRFILGARIQSAAFDLVTGVVRALQSSGRRGDALDEVDDALNQLRIGLRLSGDLGLLEARQARFASEELANIGRMIGGWRTRERLSHAGAPR